MNINYKITDLNIHKQLKKLQNETNYEKYKIELAQLELDLCLFYVRTNTMHSVEESIHELYQNMWKLRGI